MGMSCMFSLMEIEKDKQFTFYTSVMVGLLSVLGVSGMITLVGFGWYLTIEKQLSKAFDIEIFDDEEELINLFKNGLRNSCWEETEDCQNIEIEKMTPP